MTRKAVHVVFGNPRWIVEHPDSASTHHFTKDAASYTGRSLAKRMGVDLVIHDTDGTVARCETHAEDARAAG